MGVHTIPETTRISDPIPQDLKVTKTAFGEVSVADNISFIEATPAYGLIPANFRSFASASGTVSVDDRRFKVATGTTVGGYGALQSFRSINYRSGSSVVARFAGYFPDSVANSWQGIGLLSVGDELSFGYNGTEFGIWYRKDGLPEVRTLTVTTASSGSTDLTLTLNSVAYTIPLTAGTIAHNCYEISSWLNANQSVWQADNLGSTVIITALTDSAKSGTYSFSHASAAGTIAQTRAGVTKTSTHVPQADWNGVVFSGFNPALGNVYQIKYHNGFGDIEFYIENPTTGDFDRVHTIQYPNQFTTSNLGNPSLRVGLYAASIGSTTDLSVYAVELAGFVQGNITNTRNSRSFAFTQTLTTPDFTNVLTLRNRKTYNAYFNQVEISPLALTFASEVNKNVLVEIRATTAPTIELQFNTVGNNLIGDVATTASTGFSGGRLIASFVVPPSGGAVIDLTKLEIRLPPTLNLIIQAKRVGGASGDVTATLTWYEDL